MKMQIKRVEPLQAAKVLAVFYFIIAIPLSALMMLASQADPAHSLPLGMLIMMPLMYAVFGFIFIFVGAWLYNRIAAQIGGIEITLEPAKATEDSSELTVS